MRGITTVILCSRCKRVGSVGWGAARPDAKGFAIASLSAGFLLIEGPDGAARIECSTCRAPVEGLGKLLSGWEREPQA